MKQALKRLYDVPVLGYALRFTVGLVRLPTYLRAHDDALQSIHAWLQQVDPKIQRAESAHLAATSHIRDLSEKSAELWKITTEAHGQATYLTQRQDAIARQLSLTESALTRLQAGLDQHLPVLLGFVSSHGAATRELQRGHLSLRDEVAALLARVDGLQGDTERAAQAATIMESRAAEAEKAASIRSRTSSRGSRSAPWSNC